MQRSEARDLLPLVNEREQYERLQAYAELRINDLMVSLSFAENIETVRKLQGAIGELRRFRTLREEVRGVMDEQAR